MVVAQRTRQQQKPVDLTPRSIQAEQAVLGGILSAAWRWDVERPQVDAALGLLEARDFYYYAHQCIWEAMLGVVRSGDPPNLVFVDNELIRLGKRDDAHAPAYLGELDGAGWPETPYVANHARIVRTSGLQRRIADAAARGDADGIAEASQGLAQIGAPTGNDDFPTMREAIESYFERIGDDATSSVRTGLNALDSITGGFRPGNLVVIAARPAEGKSALGQTIAHNVAIRGNQPIGFLSLEMSTPEIIQRLIAMDASISTQEAKQYTPKSVEAQGRIAEAPLYIRHPPSNSINDVLATAGPLVRQQGCAAIVIDYLQLMTSKTGGDNRSLDLAAVTRSLKQFAQIHEIPVILLAQLNRGSENRSGPPRIADIAESDAPARDADIILLIDWTNDDKPLQVEPVNLMIAKHRNGPTDVVRLQFVRKTTRFVETEWGF